MCKSFKAALTKFQHYRWRIYLPINISVTEFATNRNLLIFTTTTTYLWHETTSRFRRFPGVVLVSSVSSLVEVSSSSSELLDTAFWRSLNVTRDAITAASALIRGGSFQVGKQVMHAMLLFCDIVQNGNDYRVDVCINRTKRVSVRVRHSRLSMKALFGWKLKEIKDGKSKMFYENHSSGLAIINKIILYAKQIWKA